MSKVVSAMTVQGHPTSSRGPQYQGALSYIGREQQPQLAHGANGRLQLSVTYFYCKDTKDFKNKRVWLNKKMVQELQAQKQATVVKRPFQNQVLLLKYQINNGSSDLGPV